MVNSLLSLIPRVVGAVSEGTKTFNGGSEFSMLVGNPFVESPPWLKYKLAWKRQWGVGHQSINNSNGRTLNIFGFHVWSV